MTDLRDEDPAEPGMHKMTGDNPRRTLTGAARRRAGWLAVAGLALINSGSGRVTEAW
jgi:hypothetical protein